MTWRDETRTCSCGEQFEARIGAIDGKDAHATTQCPKCADTALREERYAEAMDKLGAAADEQMKRWIAECNCPVPLLVKTFDGFEKARQRQAHKLMSTWDWTKDKSIVLQSSTFGVGKTHLCGSLVNKMLRTEKPAWLVHGYYVQTRMCPVYFTTEPQLLDRIRATFNRTDETTETDDQIYKRLGLYQVLIIDDVGKLKPRDISFLQGVYFRIIDSRCVAKKPLVLTTNLTLAELEAHIGGACADRIREMCGTENIVQMRGKSYRVQEGVKA